MRVLLVELKNSESMREKNIRESRESVYVYSSFLIFVAEKWIDIRCSPEGREREMRTLHQTTCMLLDDLKSTCTRKFRAELKSNMKLNGFPNLVSYCSDTL